MSTKTVPISLTQGCLLQNYVLKMEYDQIWTSNGAKISLLYAKSELKQTNKRHEYKQLISRLIHKLLWYSAMNRV